MNEVYLKVLLPNEGKYVYLSPPQEKGHTLVEVDNHTGKTMVITIELVDKEKLS